MGGASLHLAVRWLVLIGGLWCAALSAGCGPKAADGPHPVWPAAPAAPRVVHVKNVQTASDVASPTFLQRLRGAVAGETSPPIGRPHGVAVQPGKHLYVTDQDRQAVLVFSLKSAEARQIAAAGETFFVSPVGVAACGDLLAVSDSSLNAVFVLNGEDDLVRRLTKPGGFQRPTGLAWDAERGVLYVVDTLANEVCAFDPRTGELLRRFGEPGMHPGQFNYPTHICVDGAGKVYVTDSLNFRVQAFDRDGKYLFYIGKQGDATGHLAVPKGVAVDAFGHIYIVDSYLSTVQIFDAQGRFLLAVGGPGENAGEFQVPAGIAVTSDNRIYICDSYNNRVQILEYVGGATHESDSNLP